MTDRKESPEAVDESPGPQKKKYLRTIFIKNSTPIPNWFLDEVLCDPDVPHAARSVFLFLVRKTVGWDNRTEELSLEQIQYGAGVSRPIAIHALWVICECWGLFKKTRGRMGQHSSVYEIGDLSQDNYEDRTHLILRIFDTVFPTPAQVRSRPKPGGKPDEREEPKKLIASWIAKERQLRDQEERSEKAGREIQR